MNHTLSHRNTLHLLRQLCIIGVVLLLVTSCRKKNEELSWELDQRLNEVQRERNQMRIALCVSADESPWMEEFLEWGRVAQEELMEREKPTTVDIFVAKTLKEQLSQLRNLCNGTRLNAIVILSDYPEELGEICQQFRERGVLVVAVHNNILMPGNPDLFVCGDNAGMGQESARAMIDALGGEEAQGTILAFTYLQNRSLADRLTYFEQYLMDHTGFKLETEDCEKDGYDLVEASRAALRRHPHVDGIWTGWDDLIPVIMQICQEEGRTDVKAFIGGGGSPTVLQMIRDGNPLTPFDVFLDRKIIYEAIMMTQRHLELVHSNKPVIPPPSFVVLPTNCITKENAAEFLNAPKPVTKYPHEHVR